MDFGGAALFASGPFEVIDGPIGKREDGAGTLVAIAPEVVVRGELRAADGAGIDALRAAVRTRVGTTAALVGERGRAYGAAELLRYSERGVRVAGGVWSCGYEAVFRL